MRSLALSAVPFAFAAAASAAPLRVALPPAAMRAPTAASAAPAVSASALAAPLAAPAAQASSLEDGPLAALKASGESIASAAPAELSGRVDSIYEGASAGRAKALPEAAGSRMSAPEGARLKKAVARERADGLAAALGAAGGAVPPALISAAVLGIGRAATELSTSSLAMILAAVLLVFSLLVARANEKGYHDNPAAAGMTVLTGVLGALVALGVALS